MSADLAAAEDAFRRADYLRTYDIAHAAVERGDQTLRLRYLEALSAVRLGNVAEALRRYRVRGLDRETDVDSLGLGARLLKDQAFLLSGDARLAKLREAAAGYEEAMRRTSSAFPAVNAASLWFIAGDQARGTRIAQEVLDGETLDSCRDYFSAVTCAEALLLLGRSDDAFEAAAHAFDLPGCDTSSRVSTVTQFERLSPVVAGAERIAELLRPRSVMMFCGHIFLADDATETRLAGEIDAAIAAEGIGIGYGALAAGADILIAERLLHAGGEVHFVLPFLEEDFIVASVERGGPGWLDRYRDVKEAAATIIYATRSDYVGDPAQLAYGSDVAMGMTRLRASHLHTRAIQLAISDGGPAGDVGTARDVARWQAAGGRTKVIDGNGLDRPPVLKGDPVKDRRQLKALLFTDFPSFSSLEEQVLPIFWSEVMGTAGSVLRRHAAYVDTRNTWGDAIYAVLTSAAAAAEVALELQEGLARVDPSRLRLSAPAYMRISLHYGPVYFGRDPITGLDSYYGIEVSRAARVEPITPPGSVYVSEPVAAILALEAPDQYRSTFVGTVELPKKFGAFAVYALQRTVLN